MRTLVVAVRKIKLECDIGKHQQIRLLCLKCPLTAAGHQLLEKMVNVVVDQIADQAALKNAKKIVITNGTVVHRK